MANLVQDPREYLPFLRNLRALPAPHVQRYAIDDHLGRRDKALRHLAGAGESKFAQALEYTEQYSLYDTALELWKNTERYEEVLTQYGGWLFERREWNEAAAVFVEAGQAKKAMLSYERALEWQLLFEFAVRNGTEEEEVKGIAKRVAQDLSSKKRFVEAARVVLDYVQDLEEAVTLFTLGNAFSEARRIAAKSPSLLDEVIKPAIIDERSHLGEELSEMRDQLERQYARLLELRKRRVEEPDAFFGDNSAALADVDVMTDAGTEFTKFTRYTIAPTTISKTSTKCVGFHSFVCVYVLLLISQQTNVQIQAKTGAQGWLRKKRHSRRRRVSGQECREACRPLRECSRRSAYLTATSL